MRNNVTRSLRIPEGINDWPGSRKSIIAKAKHPRRAAFDRRVPQDEVPVEIELFSTCCVDKGEGDEKEKKKLLLLLSIPPQKTHTSYKLKAKSLLSNARNALYPAGCKISASLFRWLLARLNTRASRREIQRKPATITAKGNVKRASTGRRTGSPRVGKGWTRNGSPIVRSPPPLLPSPRRRRV